jgi:predicted alpha/beta-fold hydrolase
MPVLPTPSYRPPFPFTSGHLQTIYPSLFRHTPPTNKEQERLNTPDGDFLDIDWHHSPTGKTVNLAIISHGLEGNSRKKYVLGMARQLNLSGWDVICLNFRGCSGETNKLLRFYHSGVTDDLHTVINHGIEQRDYKRIALVGFSMGGNQTLKYLGEDPTLVPPLVQAAVVFSVPCKLADSVSVMNGWQNRLYMHYFMKGLRQKVRDKAAKFPTLIDPVGLDAMKTFEPFDNKYTGPIHGFTDASDYYEKCSSAQFLHAIHIPTLIVQALDDPFLSASCYPLSEARQNPHLFLEVPQYGGHVGFMGAWNEKFYWSEKRVVQFLKSIFN